MAKDKKKITLAQTRSDLGKAEANAWDSWRTLSDMLMGDIDPFLPELLRKEVSTAFSEMGAAAQRLTSVTRALREISGQATHEAQQQTDPHMNMRFDEEIEAVVDAIVGVIPEKGQIGAKQARNHVRNEAREALRDFLA